jgi:predicted O-methyltransferase YrrM
MGFENLIRKFHFVRQLEQDNERLRREINAWTKFSSPGHFYSPLPSAAEVEEAYARGEFGPPFAGIELREAEQLALLEKLAAYYAEQPFPEQATEGRRYYLANPSYRHFDGLMLYCMLRHLSPRRMIEVGSGFSSAAMLDTNEQAMGGQMELTFIDPDMSRLRSLLRKDDTSRVRLIEKRVQDVPLDVFAQLADGDILFIDSSHVSKIGSDVNRLYFEVLPMLRQGVHVHIHDVMGNLEYPREWYAEGRAWNEQYLLRSFLMFNRVFQVELFTAWLFDQHQAFFRERMPLCMHGGGGQIWLRCVR